MGPRGAIPSGSGFHRDPEYMAATMAEQKRVRADRRKQIKQLANIAALTHHPGWQTVKAEFEKRITAFESGEALRHLVSDDRLVFTSNASIGEQTRVNIKVADELRGFIQAVEGAQEALTQIEPEPPEQPNA